MNGFKRVRTDSIHIPFDILTKIVDTILVHSGCWDISTVINLLLTCTEFKMHRIQNAYT